MLNKLLQIPSLKGINNKSILSFGNHLSLAATGFFTSGFENALIIVVNGSSENISTSLFTANKDEIKIIRSFDASQSLGYFYTAAGIYLGFDMWDESKTMGLSAYGNAIYDLPITLTENGYKIEGIVDFERAFWGDPAADFPAAFVFVDDIRKEHVFLESYLKAVHKSAFTQADTKRYQLYRLYLAVIMAIKKCLKKLERG